MDMIRRLLTVLTVGAVLGLLSLGGAGFGLWLVILIEDASAIGLLLTAMAGFGVWSLLAAGFGLAFWRAWHQRT